jgi:Na+-transporting methylmalonyl-CoA/oxaloacetate decarboxylase gamma subunit
MLHDILTFISQNFFFVFLLLLAFGGGIGAFINRIVNNQQQRKERDAKRKHELAVLAEKRQIAEAAGDAIKLLVVDRDLGADFDRRLQEALALQAKTQQNGGVRIAPDEVREEEQPADDAEGNGQRRKARR